MKTEAIDLPLVKDITRSLTCSVKEWFDADAILVSDTPEIRDFRHSFFFRYLVQTNAGKKAILVKICRKAGTKCVKEAVDTQPLHKRALGEYQMLQQVWRVFDNLQDPEFIAIQPYSYLDSWNAIAMSELDIQPLKSLLFQPGILLRNAAAWSRLQDILGRVARWLRVFHDQVGLSFLGNFESDVMRDQINAEIILLSKNSKEQVDPKPIQKLLQPLIDSAACAKLPVAVLHGDFQYSNIFIDAQERVCALDPCSFKQGPVYSDLATLLIDPETRFLQILSFNTALSKQKLKQLRQIVLSNYCRTEIQNPTALNLCCAKALLHKWAVDEEKVRSLRVPGKLQPAILNLMRQRYRELLNFYLAGSAFIFGLFLMDNFNDFWMSIL